MYIRIKLGIGAIVTAGAASLVGWLALSGTVAQPLPGRPSQALVQMIEAAAHGQTPPFLSDLAGHIPAGAVLVAQTDQVDAGAEEGHAVPITVWVDGVEQVAGLHGSARFAPVPGGYQVTELQLDLLPLQVGTWEQATTRAQAIAAGARRAAQSPFFGRFRFTDGARLVAVDAITGQVEEE